MSNESDVLKNYLFWNLDKNNNDIFHFDDRCSSDDGSGMGDSGGGSGDGDDNDGGGEVGGG